MADLQRKYLRQQTHRRGARLGAFTAQIKAGFGEASKSEWWIDSLDAPLVNRGRDKASVVVTLTPDDVTPIVDSRTLF